MDQTIAITGATVVTMDESRAILDDALVVVQNDLIVEVMIDAPIRTKADYVIDGRGKVLIPGLVNCHLHSRPARALGDSMSMEDWHAVYAENVSLHMSQEDSRVGSLVAFAESIKAGTTSVLDMTFKPLGAGEAACEIGIRAMIVPLASDMQEMMDRCDSYEDNIDLVENYNDLCPSRVQFWMGCDSIIETSPQMLLSMTKAAQKYGVGIHTHMSEALFDTEFIPKNFGGRRAADYLNEQGLLGPRTVLAHCNWLTADEIDILRSTDTKVAHCPTSNMKYGTGVCPVPALIKEGVTVGLGTDGMLSNFKLDMFEVMRGACMLHRITNFNANALSSQQALEMATLGGAKTLGMDANVGSIQPGKKADMVLLDFTDVKFSPLVRGKHDNLVAMLVWTASGDDVVTVLIDGQVVMKDRQLTTVDQREVAEHGTRVASRILANF